MTLSVDGFLAKIGSMGRFQWTLVCMLGIIFVPVAFQLLIMTFLGLEPPWRCVKNSSVCNFTQEFSPTGDDPNKDFRCDINDTEWEFTNPYTSIITEWRLVCGKSALGLLANSITFLGWFFGNIIFGILSDKYGRRKILFFSVCLVCWVAFASSFVPWYWLYAILRFIIGFGVGGSIVCLFTIATEYVGPNHRAMAGTFIWYFSAVSLMLIALLAYLIRDWRKLSMITSAPGLILFFFWIVVPESVRWLMTHGKVAQAEKILKRVAKTNKKEMPEEGLGLPEEQKSFQKEAGLKDLFGSPSMTKKTIISWISHFANAQVFYGVSLASVLLGGNMYLNFFLTSLAELPGNAFAIYAMNSAVKQVPRAGNMQEVPSVGTTETGKVWTKKSGCYWFSCGGHSKSNSNCLSRRQGKHRICSGPYHLRSDRQILRCEFLRRHFCVFFGVVPDSGEKCGAWYVYCCWNTGRYNVSFCYLAGHLRVSAAVHYHGRGRFCSRCSVFTPARDKQNTNGGDAVS